MATNATLADFRARSWAAQFTNVLDATVTAALVEATQQCSEHFGDDLALAQCLYAAHLLSLGPFGQESNEGESGDTRFLEQWKRLATPHFRGPYVIGQTLP